MLLPSESYHRDVARGYIESDPAQLIVVQQLDRILKDLVARKQSWQAWLKPIGIYPAPVKGLYLHGGVGRGKTYLMDKFFECIDSPSKKRMHFHRFMFYVHDKLKSHQDNSTKNPLMRIAKDFAQEANVLCFDEFFVSDVTDAMIMAGLFSALFHYGITLIATSNILPDDLYRNGVQRDRFLPVISLIKRHTTVMQLDSELDYRLRQLKQAKAYHFPHNDDTVRVIERDFELISGHARFSTEPVCICKRPISVKRVSEGVIWCDFSDICETPRSQLDFIELAKIYHTVIISELKPLNPARESAARRFIALVDEFYDHNVKLILTADVAFDDIYQGQQYQFEFQRTTSRLIEMQSEEYLARQHNP